MNIKKHHLYFIFLLLFPIMVYAEPISVTDFDELKEAITNNEREIIIENDLTFNSSIAINNEFIINGNNHTLNRDSSYKGGLFTISAQGNLTITDLTIDGGAPNWEMDYENRYYTGANDTGYVRVPTLNVTNDIMATVSLITNSGTLEINNATIINNYTSVSGSVLKGTGNSKITNTTFNHNGSKTTGGCIYLTGGSIEIDESEFRNNVAGVNTTSAHAGVMYTTGVNLVKINNSIFEDNLVQSNGGALYIILSNLDINNSKFIHNMSGNDGSAIDLQAKSGNYKIKIDNTIFENNYGMARNGQSMGTIYLEQWVSTEEEPIQILNSKFLNNSSAVGGAIADYANANTYVYLENVEVSENNINAGGLAYCQLANYHAKNVYVHDHQIKNGASFYLYGYSDILLEDSVISNNVGTGSGVGIYQIAGSITIKNTEISNNESTEARGGGIFVRGYYDGNDPVLVIEDSVIKDNKAATTGGGIAISDNETIFSNITIDSNTKIYNNVAQEAGDDFSYVRQNNSENTSDHLINLGNISLSGIIGIDGWYQDSADNRYADIAVPETFEDYTNNNGQVAFYIKAGGLNEASYDGNGGNTNALPITIKYGQTYVVDNDIPIREGYDFVEWNTKSDGTGISLKAGDSYDGIDGYILYAMWNKQVHEEPEEPVVPEVPSDDTNPQTGVSINTEICILAISALGLIYLFKKIR